MEKEKLTEEEQFKKRNEFDQYFREREDDYILKLYEFPKENPRRKEWIEDYYNQLIEDEYILKTYGAGHFVVVGTDEKGNIKDKHIYISHRAAERIEKAKEGTQSVEVSTIHPMENRRGGQGDTFSDKLVFKLIEALAGNKNQTDPLVDFQRQMDSFTAMQIKNMETINNHLMTNTKKLAGERLEDKEPEKPSWIQDIANSVGPFLNTLLQAKGVEENLIKEEIQKSDQYQKIAGNQENLDHFYNILADDLGDNKADEIMVKLGFTVNNEPEKNPNISDVQTDLVDNVNGGSKVENSVS